MNILLVEDDRKLSRAMVAMFEEDENNVDVAYDGERGLELALEHPYDVIVLDVMLPRMERLRRLPDAARATASTRPC